MVVKIFSRWRGHPDLPLHRDPTARFLPAMIALLVFLVTIGLGVSFYVTQLAERWARSLEGHVTVQIPGSEPQSGPSGATIDKVLAQLQQQPGVARARRVNPKRQRKLLEPWLGNNSAIAELPIPAMIDVRLNNASRFDAEAVQKRLRKIAPETVVDDHSRWLADIRQLANAVNWLVAGIVGLIVAGATWMIVFAVRMGLAIHAREIDLLHTMGAPDSYIAGQFQRQIARWGLRGALSGLAAAGVALAFFLLLRQTIDTALLAQFAFSPRHVLAFAAVPIATAGIAWAAARWTVLRDLARRP